MGYDRFDDLFEGWRYPAGESHVRLREGIDPAAIDVIEVELRGFEDLGRLLTADRLLAHLRVRARWFAPYFPFARHDRRIDGRDGLELDVALDLVRDLDLTIVDPHSDVTARLRHIPQAEVVRCLRRAGLVDREALVVIPDAGATKKAYTWLDGSDAIQGRKRRDPMTGRLSGFEVDAEDLEGRPCLVVDDICDGGGTFIGLAEGLAKRGAGPLTLVVSHGLFTKGIEPLARHFDRILTFGPEAASDGPLRVLPYRRLYEEGEKV